MAKLVGILSLVLLMAAAVAFGFGIHALVREEDLKALYLLAVGSLLLKSSTEILRPRPEGR